MIQTLIDFAPAIGLNTIILFFITRYFSKKDKAAEKTEEEKEAEACAEKLRKLEWDLIKRTLCCVTYSILSRELEILLSKGYATPEERKTISILHGVYVEQGWNGDMDSRMRKVYNLPTDRVHKRKGEPSNEAAY